MLWVALPQNGSQEWGKNTGGFGFFQTRALQRRVFQPPAVRLDGVDLFEVVNQGENANLGLEQLTDCF